MTNPRKSRTGLLLGIAVVLGSTTTLSPLAAQRTLIGRQRSRSNVAIDSTAAATNSAERVPATTRGTRRSFVIPPLEIVGFDFLLNRFDERSDHATYAVTGSSIRHNLRARWVVDNDPFRVNQLYHPFQGSMYHDFARSAGLDYWPSFGYTVAGAVLWEIAGETTLPSRNDLIASGIAGTFLGEPLFRMANLVLGKQDGVPSLWRRIAAVAISPSTGWNRLAFGARFRQIYDSHDAVYANRLEIGGFGTAQSLHGPTANLKQNEAIIDYSMDYGLPGKPAYDHSRPFDYFSLQATSSSASGIESIMTRGTLFARRYEFGQAYRGVWGLFGSYGYLSPQIFRVSSTAISLGTVGQLWLTRKIAMQGTGLAGAGYAAAGSIHGIFASDYHYGLAPQAMVGGRLIYGDRVSVDARAREYFVSNVAAANTTGHDNIVRTDLSGTVRIYQQHALSLRYLWYRRDATNMDLGHRVQIRGTVGVFYTLLGHDRFGAVDWRN